MPQTTLRLPDGKTITLNHDEGTTAEELRKYAMSLYKPTNEELPISSPAVEEKSYGSKVATDLKRVLLDTQRDVVGLVDLLPGDAFGLDALSEYERDKELSKLSGFGYLDTSNDIDPVSGKIKTPETAVGIAASIVPYIAGAGAIAKVGSKIALKVAPKMKALSTATKYTLSGAGASQVLTDTDANLFNVVSDIFPEDSENTILDYLSADENDTETAKRMKLLIGDLGAGFAIDRLFKIAPSLKNMVTAKKPSVDDAMGVAEEIQKSVSRSRRGESAKATAKEEDLLFRSDIPSIKLALKETEEGAAQIAAQSLIGKKGFERVKAHMRRTKAQLFTSRGYSSSTMFRAFDESQHNQASLITKSQNIAKQLNLSFKNIADETIRKGEVEKAHELLTADLSKYTKLDYEDQVAAFAKGENISEGVASSLLDARQLIDELSYFLAGSKGIKSEVKDRIMDNMGIYLQRSYSAFKDPKKFVVDPKQRTTVISRITKEKYGQALKTEAPLSMRQAKNLATREIDDLLGKADKSQVDYFTQVRRVARFHQKKKVPEDIRKLLGEIKDPADNIILSVTNAARVYETNNFYLMVNELGRSGKYIHSKGTKAKPTKAALSGKYTATIKSTNTLLDGKITTPEIAKVLNRQEETFEFMNSSNGAVDIYKTFLRYKGMSQASKTIYSLPTHIRNVVGGFQFGIANGDLSALNPLSSNRGHWDIIKNQISRGGDKALDREYEKLIKLGVINTSVNVNMFRELINIGGSNFGKKRLTDIIADNKFLKGAEDVYMGTDDYFKISNYTKELETLKKARPSVADDVLEREAADITANTFPNYDRVPKALKRLTYSPIGNFIAFPAEIIRTSVNIVKQAGKEINSGNTVLRNRGLQRLAGFTTATVGMGQASKISADLMGWTDEEREYNTTLAEGKYDENANFIWYRDDKGETRKVSTKYLDSYNAIKEPIAKALDRIANGELRGEQLDEYLLKAGWDGTKTLLSPFISESIGTKAILDVYTAWSAEDGRTSSGKVLFAPSMTTGEKLFEGVGALYSAVEPGTVTGLRKLTTDIDPYTGEEDDKIGPVSIPAIQALFGFKSTKHDPDTQIGFAVSDYNKNIRNNVNLGLKIGKDTKLSVVEKYIARQSKTYEYQQKLFKSVNAYNAIYGRLETHRLLKKSGLTAPAIRDLISGEFKPNNPPEIKGKLLEVLRDDTGENSSSYIEQLSFNRDFKDIYRLLSGLSLYGETTIDPFDLKEETVERLQKAIGGEVSTPVPNAPTEPDERINKLTGLPYNEGAGTAYMDQDDPMRVLNMAAGGKVLNKLKRNCNK